MWNLGTSSLDRNLINLRCACGTCAETKNVLDCTREPPCCQLIQSCGLHTYHGQLCLTFLLDLKVGFVLLNVLTVLTN